MDLLKLLDLDKIIEKVTKHVMKVVNKHHSSTRKDLANYKDSVKNIVKDFNHLEYRCLKAIDRFNDKHSSLPAKLQEIKDMITAHSIGVQNVYEKFVKIEKQQNEIIKLIKKTKLKKLLEEQ